jgi:hypothetical protein
MTVKITKAGCERFGRIDILVSDAAIGWVQIRPKAGSHLSPPALRVLRGGRRQEEASAVHDQPAVDAERLTRHVLRARGH